MISIELLLIFPLFSSNRNLVCQFRLKLSELSMNVLVTCLTILSRLMMFLFMNVLVPCLKILSRLMMFLFMDVLVQYLTILSRLMMFVQSCIQSFRGFITRNSSTSSLVNVWDNDFISKITNSHLFELDSNSRYYD